MAMATPSSISLHLLIAAILTTVAIATSTASTSHVAAAPSGTAEEFLHSRCSTTKNATACYDALLPFAGSFNGSQVKISRAATSVAFRSLHSFLAELQRLQAAGGTGVGHGDQALGKCVQDAMLVINSEQEAFFDLGLLDSHGSSKEEATNALFDLKSFLSAAAPEWCIEDFVVAGDVALGSPVGRKVVSMARNSAQYVYIALDLVVGITL